MRTLFFSILTLIALLPSVAQIRDVVFEGTRYNYIQFFAEGGGVCKLATVRDSAGHWIFDGPAVLFYGNGNKLSQGPLKGDSRIGHWVHFYKNGCRQREGDYVIGELSLYTARPPAQSPVVKGSLCSGKWKYWDETGNEVSDQDFRIINDKRRLKYNILLLMDIRDQKKMSENQMNTMKYYQESWTRKYPNEVFW